jgi:four helix bundle protein
MGNYRHLKVWQKAHGLVLKVYEVTVGFPGNERYELASQLRRAAASIPTNIAEGQGRIHKKEFFVF